MTMLRLIAAGAGIAPFLLLAAAHGVRLGSEAPLFEKVRASLKGSAGAAAGRTLLVFRNSPECSDDAQGLTRLRRDVENLGTRLVVVTAQGDGARPSCAPAELSIVRDSGNQIARAYDVGHEPVAFLIDENGFTRRVIRSAALVDELRLWTDGQAVYDAQCARCHGADGRDTSYPGIKSLDGIGNRLSGKEILWRTSLSGAVDMSGWTEHQSRALAAFVAGL